MHHALKSVKLVNVTKMFGKIKAVKNLNFEVNEGEYVVILGPTGAGKTTTLKLIAGLLQPDRGEILFDNVPASALPPEERKVGFVFQGYSLFPFMTVWENVAYGPSMRGLSERDIEEVCVKVLKAVHLLERADSYPKELSGGMKQRIALARALAAQPELLLLDEPLSALDAILRVELRYELRRMVKDLGLTAIHVTHDQEEAMSIADKVVVLRKGEVEQIGSPTQIYFKPETIFTANFVGEANFYEGVVYRRQGNVSIVDVEGSFFQVNKETHYSRVVLSIRPEEVKVSKKKIPYVNCFKGKIKDFSFVKGVHRIEIEFLRDREAVVKVFNPFKEKVFDRNESVWLFFNPEKIKVYPYPPEGLRLALSIE